jgi:hypothetical protein
MTVDTFAIGEKALLLPCPLRKATGLSALYFGTEVTVVSGLLEMKGAEGGHGYVVEAFDGWKLQVVPKLLQKKPKERGPSALDSDETPNAPSQFDPAIWAPSRVVLL